MASKFENMMKGAKMEIQPGALVQWESQSGGVYKQKRGTVIAFIPSGENAEKYLPSGTIKSHIKFQYRSSIPRVLVKVMTGVNSDIETFYAPRASMLEVIKES